MNLFTKLMPLLVLWCLGTPLALHAQRNCGTMHHWEQKVAENPKLLKLREAAEQKVADWAAHHPENERGTITIPVVVHVVYANSTQNITAAQIQTQIDVLNADFARLNADAANTPAGFTSVAAASNFQFCLAQQDPNGNASNGIDRVQTTATGFNDNDDIKFLDLNVSGVNGGGTPAWDPDRYFNIWVGRLTGGLLGYAQFPDDPNPNTFGVVIDYRYFGTIGTVQAPYDLGRTTTHEVGHCFGLYHIWGDDGGSCSGSDSVTDTPNQADATGGCPSFPQFDACAALGNGYMFMNYMDYSDDACLNMFTVKQVQRMQAMYSNYLTALSNSTVCNTPVTVANDAGITDVVAPDGTVCTSSFTPIVTLRNFGTAPLNNVQILYRVDSNPVSTYSWSGTLASNATVNVTLPIMSTTNGNHTFTAYTQNPNGATDGTPTNDTNTSSFSVESGGSGAAIPLFEGFENPNAPNNGWTVSNYDSGIGWERSTAARKTGLASIFINNFNYDAAGAEGSSIKDDLISPPINLSALSSANLTFQVAYASYSAPGGSNDTWDTLQVAVVPVCGDGSGFLLYNKFSTELATAPNTTNDFVPSSSQWRQESIDLTPYSSQGLCYLVFRNISHYENNLYIDDININGIAVGLNDWSATAQQLQVIPNPFSQQANLRYTLDQATDVSLNITDLAGKTIYQQPTTQQAAGTYDLPINSQMLPAAGMYIVQMQQGTQLITQKLVKQ